jgi:hypothetical protein
LPADTAFPLGRKMETRHITMDTILKKSALCLLTHVTTSNQLRNLYRVHWQCGSEW